MEEKKIVSKKVIIGGAVVAAIIVTIIAGLIMSCETPEQKVAKLLDLGQKYLLEEDYEQAIATFDEILAIAPENVDAHIGLTDAYAGKKDFAAALDVVMNGFDLTNDERIKEKWIALGNSEVALLEFEYAETAFNRLLEREPENVDAYLGLFEVYVRQNDFEKAFEVVSRGYELSGYGYANIQTFQNVAVTLYKGRMFEEEQLLLEQMSGIFGEDYRIYMDYAFMDVSRLEAARDRKTYQQFLTDYQKAAALYEEQKDEEQPDGMMDTLEQQYQKLIHSGW